DPEFTVARLVGRISKRREIARQGIEPNPHNLRWISGHLDSPAARTGARSRDAHVTQPRREESLDLSRALARLNPEPARFEGLPNWTLVAREPEEPVLLLDDLGRLAVLGAESLGELVGVEELLAPDAIEPAV